jgi:hypothetical protein
MKVDTTKPPYNGLFWCEVRKAYFRWEEYMRFFAESK